MAEYKQTPKSRASVAELTLKLFLLESPEVQGSLGRLRRRYGRYASSADQVREMMDNALGDRTLTELLYELRGK
ncbi:MAG: hypothetical protein Q8O86_03840 [Dehalococcoidia bacterium]|nr:hypothetical protein [Dehalococcoidia bacterium]